MIKEVGILNVNSSLSQTELWYSVISNLLWSIWVRSDYKCVVCITILWLLPGSSCMCIPINQVSRSMVWQTIIHIDRYICTYTTVSYIYIDRSHWKSTIPKLRPCPHCTLKLFSLVSGMGSMPPHYTQFHPNGFHLVSPETFRRVGFKKLRFVEHTCMQLCIVLLPSF